MHNVYNNTNVGDEGNEMEVGMNYFLWYYSAMLIMILHAYQQDGIRDDAISLISSSKTWNMLPPSLSLDKEEILSS